MIGILIGVAACVLIGYVALMALFEGTIKADVSDRIHLIPSEKAIVLPWYMSLGVREWGVREGTDDAGNAYSEFIYELPEIWEDSEMIMIVSWEDQQAMLYAGQSRAMDVVDREYGFVRWEQIEAGFLPDDG